MKFKRRLSATLLTYLLICGSVSAIKAIESSNLPIFNLYITEDLLEQLDEDLNKKTDNTTDLFRHDEFINVKGKLMFKDVVYKVRAGYRGDSRIHWGYLKKSWRINIRGNKSINLTDKFNLLNPKHYNQFADYLAYVTGEKLGLLSPRTDFVVLNINNEYAGVYQYVEQTDKYFLHARGRIPNDIYNGDIIYTPSYSYLGDLTNTTLWNTPDVWIKRDREYNNYVGLEYLLDVINSNSSEKFIKLDSILDIDKYLRLIALIDYIDSNHLDGQHNYKLYFNPSSGKLEPIVWDLGGFSGYSKTNANEVADPISRIIYENPKWITIKNQYLWECLNSYCSINNISAEFDRIYNNTYHEYLLDEHKNYGLGDRLPLTEEILKGMPDEFYSWITKNNKRLEGKLRSNDIKVHLINVAEALYILTFIVDGESGIEVKSIDIPSDKPIQIYRDINLDFELDEKDKMQGAYDSSNGNVNISDNMMLYSGRMITENTTTNYRGYNTVPTYYNFFIKTTSPIDVGGMTLNMINMVTREPVGLNEWEFESYPLESGIPDKSPLEKLKNRINNDVSSRNISNTMNIFSFDSSHKKIIERVNLSSDVILRENLIVKRNQILHIAPGTILRIYPNVSIIVYGKIIAEGTAKQPIQFIPYQPTSSWGSLAIQGRSSDNGDFNVLNHCIFENGSVVEYGRVQYLGMVNAHYTKLNINNCIFKRNTIGDDNFHAVKSVVKINNSQFLDSKNDAIDFDFSNGRIANSFFNNSGNDAIDLMGSHPLILDNIIKGSGDKGISVGERSHPNIINNTLTDNMIGIEIKDMSNPLIENSTITKSGKIGIHGYHKNMIYDYGGRGVIRNSLVVDNNKDFLMEDGSFLQVEDDNPTSIITRAIKVIGYYIKKLGDLL